MSSKTITHPEYGEVVILAKFSGGVYQVKDMGGIVRRVSASKLVFGNVTAIAEVQHFMSPSIAAPTPPTAQQNINTLDANALSKAAGISRVIARRILDFKPAKGFESLEHLRELVGDVTLSDNAIAKLEKLSYETRQSE
jgi:DNA uptake protein ComE-like DNA-binding protein